MSTVKKALKASALAMLLFFSLYNFIYCVIFPTRLPSIFGYSKAIINSGSMEPEYSVGDMIICKRQESYTVGEVVVFYDNDNKALIMHRIIDKGQSGFITKGDFNHQRDSGELEEENIIGSVIKKIPNVKTYRDIAIGVIITLIAQSTINIITATAADKKAKDGDTSEEKL